jgi:GNAT superfamily N-acetyltransferase
VDVEDAAKSQLPVRRAGPGDVDAVSAALATGFAADPVWGWAVPGGRAQQVFWAFWARNGVGHELAWVTPGAEATSLWVAPGTSELDDEGEADLDHLCHDLLGESASRVFEVLERLEAVHPSEPHHYLSLLATHDDHRGRGLGMGLLAANLSAIDATGAPAYLESTNPANLRRYASVGFEPRDEVRIPGGGQIVTTMWRPGASPQV